MKLQIVTTITTLIDLRTFESEHSVEIVPEPGVPESIARAAAIGGCRATLNTLQPDEPPHPAPSGVTLTDAEMKAFEDATVDPRDIGGNGL